MSKMLQYIVAVDGRCVPQQEGVSLCVPHTLSCTDVVVAQRGKLEESDDYAVYRQIIGYITIRNASGQYLLYKRTPKGGEKKLHDKTSIGFGGHIDVSDLEFHGTNQIDIYATIAASAHRELIEELGLSESEVLGLTFNKDRLVLSDNSNAVGKRHLAVVMEVVLDRDIGSAEGEIEVLGWMTPEDILEHPGDLEPWSRKILEVVHQ